jgi:replication factor C subunit 3/5
MAGTAAAAPMDIDAAAPPGAAAKGKAPLSATGRAAPWVEKYRPQSLADVAAHRDIVDTSKWPRPLCSSDACCEV